MIIIIKLKKWKTNNQENKSITVRVLKYFYIA